MTPESFTAWKGKFAKEMKLKRLKDTEDHLKSLTGREREEIKRVEARPTGSSSA